MRLALFQPDIPQNAGTSMRLAACLNLCIDIVGPCGFVLDDRRLRRAGMDYLDHVEWRYYDSWSSFRQQMAGSARLILLTTRASTPYTDFVFQPDDCLMVGRETTGVPQEVHDTADGRVVIPMQPPLRSLNVAVAASMVVGEALRQTGGFPQME